MQVWENQPPPLADGILDDETYDWIADVRAMRASGGTAGHRRRGRHRPAAHRLATAAGFDVSATGSAGLAGALSMGDQLDPTTSA